MDDIIVKKGDTCYVHTDWCGNFGFTKCVIRKIEIEQRENGEEVHYYIRYTPPFDGYSQYPYTLGKNLFLNAKDVFLSNIKEYKEKISYQMQQMKHYADKAGVDADTIKNEIIETINIEWKKLNTTSRRSTLDMEENVGQSLEGEK